MNGNLACLNGTSIQCQYAPNPCHNYIHKVISLKLNYIMNLLTFYDLTCEQASGILNWSNPYLLLYD